MVDASEITWKAFGRPAASAPPPFPFAAPAIRSDWHRPQTAAELVIADLADGEADALACAAKLAEDNTVLREMLSIALHQRTLAEAHLDSARAAVASLREAERLRLCGACRRAAA